MSNAEMPSITNDKIAVGIDDAFVLPLVTLAFSSLPEGRDATWNLFYFPDRLSVASRDLLTRVFQEFGIRLSLYSEEELELFDSRRHLSSSTFLKFMAFEQLGPGTVWLDSDLLLLSGWSEYKEWSNPELPLQAIADNKADKKQFNAGFMLLNQPIRTSWFEEIASAPSNRSSSDQVIFNAIYESDYGKLPKKFNYLWGRLLTDEGKLKPAVIHYGGANKPWHLSENLSIYCLKDDCVWKPYLLIQNGMLNSVSDEIREELEDIAYRVRSSRLRYFKKETYGRHLTFLLHKAGPMNRALVAILRLFKSKFPEQALHPIHKKKNAWGWPARTSSDAVV